MLIGSFTQSAGTLTVYRAETWPVRVNPNPKNFNNHDNYSTLRLEHSAYNQKIYKDMNYNKLLNFRVLFYSFGFRGCFASSIRKRRSLELQ